MNKKNKGFTLVELLAVIVILGVIMSIAGISLISTKKKANQREVESIYNTIKKLGPDVYLDKKEVSKCYTATWLKNQGYLKSEVVNPAKPGDNCDAYLIIKSSNDDMFDAYVICDGLEPEGTSPTNTDDCD